MPHELGHTRPRPDGKALRNQLPPPVDVEALRGQINDDNLRQQIALGMAPNVPTQDVEGTRRSINDTNLRQDIRSGFVGPDNRPPGVPIIRDDVIAQLDRTAQRRTGPPAGPAAIGQFIEPVTSGSASSPTAPPADDIDLGNFFPGDPPIVPTTSFDDRDVPALVARANQNLQVVPPGVSPFGGFARPTGPTPQGTDADSTRRRRLERTVSAALNSAPQLQFGQSVVTRSSGQRGRDLRRDSLDQHASRLQAGSAAAQLLQDMDIGAFKEAEKTSVVRDAAGDAFFVNPLTREVTPATFGEGLDTRQLTLPQDPRARQPTAFETEFNIRRAASGSQPDAKILQLMNQSKTDSRQTRIDKFFALVTSGFPPMSSTADAALRKRATAHVDALIKEEKGLADISTGDVEADIRNTLNMGSFK